MSKVNRTSGRFARATLIGIGLIGALVGVRIVALGGSQPELSIADRNVTAPTFAIGPIDGLTTSWYMAPPVTSIPLGTVAYFYQACPPEAVVIWTGAQEVARDAQGSTAMSLLLQPGAHTVSVRILPALPGAAEIASQCRLNVEDISVDQITVSPIEVWVDPVEVDEGLPQDELNEVTMEYFFGLSIAALRDLGNGQYRTSVDRLVHMAVEVDPPGFAPLMEWRFDGHAREIGASTTTWFTDIGNHVAEVGPLLNPEQSEIEAYSVTITSHTSGEDIIEEGEPIVFVAETDPPGYEDEITWLSSTMYGTAEPILGEGAIFIAEFNDTWGPWPEDPDVLFQWLGVKADNAAFNQDEKCDCPDPPANTRITFATDTDPVPVVCVIPVGGGLTVCQIPGGAGLLVSITDQGVVKCDNGDCGNPPPCADGCARRWKIILNPQGVPIGDNWRVGVVTPSDVCDCEWPIGTSILQGCGSAQWLGEWSWNFGNPQGTIDYLCE